MKNIQKHLMNKLRQETAKSLGKVASKVGDKAIDTTCIGFAYEPDLPQALLTRRVNQKLEETI